MSDVKHFKVLAYSPIDGQFKPVPVKSFKQVFDALQQWFAFKQPILIAYRCKVSDVCKEVSGDV